MIIALYDSIDDRLGIFFNILTLNGTTMKLYHVTPINNLNSILENGLLLDQPKTSWESDTLGVYLSDDWKELLLSDTYPEIMVHLELAVFSVDCEDDSIIPDPEYAPSSAIGYHGEQDFNSYISKDNITPENITLVGTLKFDKEHRYYSTSLLKSAFEPA